MTRCLLDMESCHDSVCGVICTSGIYDIQEETDIQKLCSMLKEFLIVVPLGWTAVYPAIWQQLQSIFLVGQTVLELMPWVVSVIAPW